MMVALTGFHGGGPLLPCCDLTHVQSTFSENISRRASGGTSSTRVQKMNSKNLNIAFGLASRQESVQLFAIFRLLTRVISYTTATLLQ